MTKIRSLLPHLVFCSLLFSKAFVFAEEKPKTIAVQFRNYHLTDELTAYLAYMPLDSFTTYFNTNVTFTHYFSDFLAWEVANAGYANAATTGVQERIYKDFGGLVAEGYDIVNYVITTNVIYTPLYMKSLVFGSKIGYGDISFVGGGGITKYRDRGNVNTLDLGFMFRYFLNPHWSLKFDFRNYFFLSADLKNNLSFGVGLSYNFGSVNELKPEELED